MVRDKPFFFTINPTYNSLGLTWAVAISRLLFRNEGSDCFELCIWKWQEVVVACLNSFTPPYTLKTETLSSGEANEPAARHIESRKAQYGVLPTTPYVLGQSGGK